MSAADHSSGGPWLAMASNIDDSEALAYCRDWWEENQPHIDRAYDMMRERMFSYPTIHLIMRQVFDEWIAAGGQCGHEWIDATSIDGRLLVCGWCGANHAGGAESCD